mmetsp:Transcript_18363/g.52569  ORF Transcript_18363/g.52569 Transcript_18363/m.52569 type:complete len:264 (-) Transcript_18363:801-1592(-)
MSLLRHRLLLRLYLPRHRGSAHFREQVRDVEGARLAGRLHHVEHVNPMQWNARGVYLEVRRAVGLGHPLQLLVPLRLPRLDAIAHLLVLVSADFGVYAHWPLGAHAARHSLHHLCTFHEPAELVRELVQFVDTRTECLQRSTATCQVSGHPTRAAERHAFGPRGAHQCLGQKLRARFTGGPRDRQGRHRRGVPLGRRFAVARRRRGQRRTGVARRAAPRRDRAKMPVLRRRAWMLPHRDCERRNEGPPNHGRGTLQAAKRLLG